MTPFASSVGLHGWRHPDELDPVITAGMDGYRVFYRGIVVEFSTISNASRYASRLREDRRLVA